MNIYELFINVFMNYAWMFLNNKWDIHEFQELSTQFMKFSCSWTAMGLNNSWTR